MSPPGRVVAVSRKETHAFSKAEVAEILLVAGQGVEGDAHLGATVRHRSRVARDPSQPNLRQVHLIHEELLDELGTKSFRVAPGELGENILTRGVALLDLPERTRLRLGEDAVLLVTGLRNPCAQIDAFRAGLRGAVIETNAAGALVRKAGVMSIVLEGGIVRPGDPIEVLLPPLPHRKLECV